MSDHKRRDDGDFAAKLKTIEEAAKLPDDTAEIAADDQGATAMAQKIDKVRDAGDVEEGVDR